MKLLATKLTSPQTLLLCHLQLQQVLNLYVNHRSPSDLKLGMIEYIWQTFVLIGFAIIKMRALLYIAFNWILIWMIGRSGWRLVLIWSPVLLCPNVWNFQNCLDLSLRSPPVISRLPGTGTAHQLRYPRLLSEVVGNVEMYCFLNWFRNWALFLFFEMPSCQHCSRSYVRATAIPEEKYFIGYALDEQPCIGV